VISRPACGSVALAFAFCVLALAAISETPAQQVSARPNYEYRQIAQQPIATGQRIEVVEFFWYGCPYCNALQPALESWLKRKPEDVELRRIPAVFRESWVPHARLYYTLEALGETDRLHQAVYHAYHTDRRDLGSGESTADWAAEQGIERARWLAAYNSAGVEQNLRQAIANTRLYEIQGTPSLVVDGRYVTSTGMTETVPGVIPILDDLILIAREQRRNPK
jgi:thiol:disulfide interchange protein DsbA